MPIELIDSHCHLDMEPFDGDRDDCIARASKAGVTKLITIGTGSGLHGARRAIALAEKYPNVWASVGIHPHSSGEAFDRAELETLARHPKVVAIGETGLDFFRDWAPVDKQRAVFREQIALARLVSKPLIIHCREAGQECLQTLLEHKAADVGGVFHCFSEDAVFAKKLRTIGFLVSFPGQITFKNAGLVRDTCRDIPLEQMLVETDSPFLAPEPQRGKRCEPAFVVHTAHKIAEVKGLSFEEVAAITTRNTLTLFSTMR